MIISATLAAAVADRYKLIANVRHTKSVGFNALIWFSPVRNIRKLICSESVDDLTCVHGIRVFTMFWIIIGHTLEWNNLATVRKYRSLFRSDDGNLDRRCPCPGNTFTMKDKLGSLEKQPLFKAHYSVDTFFYISGLLTSYVTLKYTNGEYKNFKFSSFLWLRYLRLTPQIGVFMILLSLLPPMFDGPVWRNYVGHTVDTCYRTWWRNIVYINNIFDVRNMVSR